MEIVSFILRIAGSVPILAAIVLWFMRYSRARSILRFHSKRPVDVVLSTTSADESRYGRIIRRPVTGLGQVHGVAAASKALGSLYRRKQIRVHLSEHLTNHLDEDLVLMGSAVTNRISGDFLSALKDADGKPAVIFDCERCLIQAEGFSTSRFDLNLSEEGEPARDLGLIVVSRNPWALERRAVLCCGITTYGTAAAAYFFFDVLLTHRRWDRIASRTFRRKGAGFGFIIEAHLNHGTLMGCHLLTTFSVSQVIFDSFFVEPKLRSDESNG